MAGLVTLARLGALCALAALAACAAPSKVYSVAEEQPVVAGPAARRNMTPLEPAYACLARGMREAGIQPIGIGVGDIKDYTGKYSQLEGNTITQGGALMIYSALGKLGDTVQLQERFDTRIAELELAYADRRQLGDGKRYQVEAGKPPVPWMPYFGGTIMKSSYYIVGGVTEVNYNISSGGFEFDVNGVGAKTRVFTMNVGVDLRIVDTQSLLVVRTASVQKQIVGQEVGAGVYRFFGNQLITFNVGNKSQEPLQLGVRTTIEHGVVELVAAVAGLDPTPCLTDAVKPQPGGTYIPISAPRLVQGVVPTTAAMAATTPVATPPVPARNAGPAALSDAFQIEFNLGSSGIPGTALGVLEKVSADARQGGTATIHLVVRDGENWPPAQRRELAQRRATAITDALVGNGVDERRIRTTWLPSPTDAAPTLHSAGYQRVATLQVVR